MNLAIARLAATAAAVASAWLAIAPARALDSGGFVALESDDLYHGLSQVRGQPTAVVDAYARVRDDAYVGGSVERVDLPGAGNAAAGAIYVGAARALNDDWSLGGAVSRYVYSREPADLSYDFTELQAHVRWRSRLRLDAYFSPDTSIYSARGALRNGQSGGVEVAWRQELARGFALDGGAGFRRLGGAIDSGYAYGDLGLAWRMANWQLSVQAVAVDGRAKSLFGRQTAADRWVFGLIRQFGAGSAVH